MKWISATASRTVVRQFSFSALVPRGSAAALRMRASVVVCCGASPARLPIQPKSAFLTRHRRLFRLFGRAFSKEI